MLISALLYLITLIPVVVSSDYDCDALEFIGKDYTVVNTAFNFCFRIELYAGGKMYKDSDVTNTACIAESTSGSTLELFSSFNRTTEEAVHFDEPGEWSGELVFTSDPESTEVTIGALDLDFEEKTFIGKLMVPSCMSPSSSPSSVPSFGFSSTPSSMPSIRSAAPSALLSSKPSVLPSSIPSQVPSMSPTIRPTRSAEPSATPSASPTITSSPTIAPTLPCADTPLGIKFLTDGMTGLQDCSWVAEEDTQKRCELVGVSAACPLTCGTCTSCDDPEPSESGFKFGFLKEGRGMIYRDCEWVKRRDRKNRCELTSNVCRAACKVCTIF